MQCWIEKYPKGEWRIHNAPEDYPEVWIEDDRLGAVVQELVSESLSVLVVRKTA